MKSVTLALVAILFFFTRTNGFTQIKNEKIETVKVFGNCEMCEETIEKAGSLKKVALVDWDKDTKIAKLTYDSKKTNSDEILKRIALAGYDSDRFLAPDDAYAKLPECCQYTRSLKPIAKNTKEEHHHAKETVAESNPSQLNGVFDLYFEVKDALVKSDPNQVAAKAIALSVALKVVDMNKLGNEEHMVWMKVMKGLGGAADQIAKNKNLDKQREIFMTLSKDIYELVKVSKPEVPVYYQHCPMYNNGKGSNWLSKEKAVKNPYYGSQMLTCGSTVETIKN